MKQIKLKNKTKPYSFTQSYFMSYTCSLFLPAESSIAASNSSTVNIHCVINREFQNSAFSY